MARLHELLAVASNLKNQAEKCRTELVETFGKKRHLFSERIQTFSPLTEGAESVTEEKSDIQSTVDQELEWIAGHLVKALNVQYQIAEANTLARADVELEGGKVILSGVPATALLELEKTLTEGIQPLLAAIPTLDPAKGFKLDSDRPHGIFKARDVEKPRTRKTKRVLVKYEATKEHPAQTETYDFDEITGTIRTSEWSGMITPARKADMLDRCEQLLRAVKKARSRANEIEVDVAQKRIGKEILDFLRTA